MISRWQARLQDRARHRSINRHLDGRHRGRDRTACEQDPQYQAVEREPGGITDHHPAAPAAAATNGETEEAKARSEQVWGGKPWKRSVVELGGEVLCVSQFTLFARTVKGTKPDFHRAMGGNDARVIYEALLKKLGDSYAHDRIKDGAFGEMMDVSLTNDGKQASFVLWRWWLAQITDR
ncbi:hypothetical protein PANT_7d00104 [Moesziomyces antarcticus T-34]|uniref:D-aminoacyl-tRNA deacylase n=1 Tax=Pseudozyma antarctica (strain T-34) TaxID=1151754 RepID=M9MDB4_PSEA3|nr:hypothetical protein PANT_7d00104 [Moesziomyces antarcticus T-34]